KVELLERRNFGRKFSQNDRVVSALREDVDAEPRLVAQRIRTVARARLQQIFGETAIIVDDGHGNRLGLEWREPFDSRLYSGRYQFSRCFNLRRLVYGEVKIRHVPVRIQHRSKDVIQFGFFHGLIPTLPVDSSTAV